MVIPTALAIIGLMSTGFLIGTLLGKLILFIWTKDEREQARVMEEIRLWKIYGA
tara:strand:+ start:8687 stop:8848 length:162 start_codon:yes stop_codon:yes gene_type:complete